jgi:hypothetical protein
MALSLHMYLERVQEVLDGVRGGPVGPPGPLGFSSPVVEEGGPSLADWWLYGGSKGLAAPLGAGRGVQRLRGLDRGGEDEVLGAWGRGAHTPHRVNTMIKLFH